jgi:cell division protein ZapA
LADAARVELKLLGRTLTVRSEASPQYLAMLARFVEDRARALQQAGVRDEASALALAALDIADELHRLRDDAARDGADMRARIAALVDMLERLTPRE